MSKTVSLTILSYNLWMHKAYDELPRLVQEYDVDALCLQECRPEDIAPVIGNLSLARSDPLGKLGLAMYVHQNRWQVVREAYRSLPNARYERAVGAIDRTRLQMLELESTEDDVRFIAANTHIAHLGAGSRERRKQAIQAARMTMEFANGLPLDLSGDFNHPFAEEKLIGAMKQEGLEHAVSTDSRFATYNRWPRRTFDRIFFSRMALESIKVLPFGASDHAPIMGRFTINSD